MRCCAARARACPSASAATRCCPIGWGLALVCAISAAAWAAFDADLGFTTRVSRGLVTAYERRFGDQVAPRVSEWVEFARERKAARSVPPARPDEADLLARVNAHFNRLRWVSDLEHWGVEDYWSTPAESVASAGADCEDFAIAKYFMLKELGVATAKLRIVYVRAAKLKTPHMVLAFYSQPDADPLILDNLEPAVRPASQRSDLTPVYSFNDDEVEITGRSRGGNPLALRAWRGLLERLDQEARL